MLSYFKIKVSLIDRENPLLSLIYKMVNNVLEGKCVVISRQMIEIVFPDLEDDLLKVNHNDSELSKAVEGGYINERGSKAS